jgi:hypothetical protein
MFANIEVVLLTVLHGAAEKHGLDGYPAKPLALFPLDLSESTDCIPVSRRNTVLPAVQFVHYYNSFSSIFDVSCELGYRSQARKSHLSPEVRTDHRSLLDLRVIDTSHGSAQSGRVAIK